MTLNWLRESEEYRWLAALVAMTALAFAVASWFTYTAGLPPFRLIYLYFRAVFINAHYALWLAGASLVCRALYLRTWNPFRGLLSLVTGHVRSPALVIAGVLPVALVPILMASFGTLKMLMPVFRDFTWDDRLAAADRMLFFGYEPWQFTHAIFGSAELTNFLDDVYTNWVVALYAAVIAFAAFAPRYVRARFFLSFAAAWILIGVVGGYVFASAGPCYAQLVGAVSAEDFAPLMAKLKLIHETGGHFINAYYWQDLLWERHSKQIYGFAMGISAMPSMHNAIAVLYALTTRHMAKPIRIAAWTFASLIFIGSIHLGWHYAIDGILAAFMISGIWYGAGLYLDRVGYTAALRQRGEEAPEPDLPDFTPEPVAI